MPIRNSTRHLAEFIQKVDAGTAQVRITPSADEQLYVDVVTAVVTITPSVTDVAATIDAATARVSISSPAIEVLATIDSGTVYLDISSSSIEHALPFDSDLNIVSGEQRWAATAEDTGEVTQTPSAQERFGFTAETRWYIGDSFK